MEVATTLCFLSLNDASRGMFIWNEELFLKHGQKVRWLENLARVGVGMWGEALNFLNFFVSFCVDKNESLFDRTKI